MYELALYFSLPLELVPEEAACVKVLNNCCVSVYLRGIILCIDGCSAEFQERTRLLLCTEESFLIPLLVDPPPRGKFSHTAALSLGFPAQLNR